MSKISEHLLRAQDNVIANAGEVFTFRSEQITGLIGEASLRDLSKFADDAFPAMDCVIQIKASLLSTSNPPTVDNIIYHGSTRYTIVQVEYKDGPAPVYNLFVKGDNKR